MSIEKADDSDASELPFASNVSPLDEVDEIRYSKNTLNKLTESASDTSLSDCDYYGEFGSFISKEITYDIYKRFSQNNPVFLLENTDNFSMTSKAQYPKRVGSRNKQKCEAQYGNSSVKHRTSTGVQYDVPSDNDIHYSRSNSMCQEKQKLISPTSKATAQSHTGIPNVTKEKKKYAEKMTYCRPVTNNYYNKEFRFKTIEKNARLKKLVEKLASAREKEKQESAWNNFINELKIKHKYNARLNSIPIPLTYDDRAQAERIENFYNTRFQNKQSNHCKNLLQDLYEPRTTQNILPYKYEQFGYGATTSPKIKSSNIVLDTNSNGPIYLENGSILNKDALRQGRVPFNRPLARNVYSNTIFVEREYDPSRKSSVENKQIPRVVKTSSIQTDLKFLPLAHERQDEQVVTNKYDKLSEHISNIKEGIDKVRYERRTESLESIETKLDVLITSVNTLIAEIRERRISRNSSSSNNNIMTISRSVDAVDTPVTGYLFDLTHSMPKINSPRIVKFVGTSKMNNFIVEEIDKSDELKRDIENILNGEVKKSYTTSIQITDEIPTKDHSTEVSASLSKTEISGTSEEVNRDFKDGRMTMAVNTDPLGLLGLLRISRDALKSILSYIPNISYHGLLSLPQQRENTTPFVCNICGSAFAQTSELTKHMHVHVRNRDCCVCRHLMGVDGPNPRRIFFCEYCGKPFSRAYCCELHQQTCAKRLGRVHDVTSSLILLR